MTGYDVLVREEIEATIDQAGFDTLSPEALRVEVTDSFRRKLGECRPLSPADRDSHPCTRSGLPASCSTTDVMSSDTIPSVMRLLMRTFSKQSIGRSIPTVRSGKTRRDE